MKPINGVVIGLVTAVRPGEVKLKFPWLHESDSEEKESDWARIATAMAGNGRGTFFMPEVDDEVLVAFDKGDPNSPYVIGFLWNGKDKPPVSNTQLRTIKTTSGHVIEFYDKPGQGKIKIKSQGGQKIEITDFPAGGITIETELGNKISLDESTGGSISLTAVNDISLTAPILNLNAFGVLTITSPTFNYSTSTGALNMKGTMIIDGGATIKGQSTGDELEGSKLLIT